MTSEIINTSHFFDSIDVIIPVPLHPDKLKLRGYNQSEGLQKVFQELHRSTNTKV